MKIETQVGLFIVAAVGIFFYLSFNIGEWRLDGSSYRIYKAYFDNSGNLEKKSHVKIAGVTVGKVLQRNLLENGLAEVIIEVHKSHNLFRNSCAKINQEGLLGGYVLEIDAGDSSSGILPPGSNLPMPGKASASFKDIMEGVKDITDSVQDVVLSFSNVFATPDGEKMIASTLNNTLNASKKLSEFSIRLDDLIKSNRTPFDEIFKSIKTASKNLDVIVENVESKSEEFSENILTFSKDLKTSGNNLDNTLKNTNKISTKISSGEGTIGKLINDEQLYDDVKDTVKGVKGLVDKAGNLNITVDMHWASLIRKTSLDLPTREEAFPLSFNMFEVKMSIHPDYYYSISLSSSRNGPIKRKYSWFEYFDQEDNLINTSDPSFSLYEQSRRPTSKSEITQNPSEMSVNFQFCKKFNDLTLRIGTTEGTFGVGLDYDFGLKFEKARWIASLDAFDLTGSNRLGDRRPHVRVANKIYFMKKIYSYFGADDIFSKKDAAFFWGGGISFDDDDLKYIMSYLPLGKMT